MRGVLIEMYSEEISIFHLAMISEKIGMIIRISLFLFKF